MSRMTVTIGMLALLGAGSTATAQSRFERCQKEKEQIEQMERQSADMKLRIDDIDRELTDLNRRLRQLRSEKARKARDRARLERRIRTTTVHHQRRCRGIEGCSALQNQVAQLRKRIAPLARRLDSIRNGIRERGQEIAGLNRDVRRIENQYNQLGCDNLQIGQTAQSTFDRCSRLANEWSDVQRRIGQLQAAVRNLRRSYQRTMRQMRSNNTRLAALLRKFRERCSQHTESLATLERLEKDQHEYRSLEDDLDEMDQKVDRFSKLKLKPVRRAQPRKVKPKLQPKGKSNSRDRSRSNKKKPTLKPKD